jgi:hypothetical protein
LHHDGHGAAVVGREGEPARPREVVRKLLAHEADRRRVHERRDLLDLLDQHAVEERRVAVGELREHQTLLQWVRDFAQPHEEEVDLLLERHVHRRQQPAQLEPVALFARERGTLVPERIVEDVGALGLSGIEWREKSEVAALSRGPTRARERPSALLKASEQRRRVAQPHGLRKQPRTVSA